LKCSKKSSCLPNDSLVLLSLTAEPPSGIKSQCVAVASLQTGDLESVQPSTCSPRELTPRASRPLSVHFYSALLDFAPLGVCGTVQKGTAVELHAKLCRCHLAAPTLLSGTVVGCIVLVGGSFRYLLLAPATGVDGPSQHARTSSGKSSPPMGDPGCF
jgi:hypothetical protein